MRSAKFVASAVVVTAAVLAAILSVPTGTLPGTSLLGTSTAEAADGLPTASVSLGDSYIAGEAGRWNGNSSVNRGNRLGTDRAAYISRWRWHYSPFSIYGDTYDSGCHRSDVAPILSAEVGVEHEFNLACSGASTVNLISSASGGESYRGEAPQVDQLAEVASTHDVELVVVSVGGNDLGFSDIIISCVTDYVTSTRWAPNTCNRESERDIQEKLPAAMAGVSQALSDIRTTLAAAGDTDYRLVLQSYPTPIVSSENARFVETGWRRTFTGGCPFWDADMDWANEQLIPTLTNSLADVAAANGAEFLDLSAALNGREACAATASPGSGANAEWIRFVNTGILQGDAEESVHPNALGQQAMGRCLTLLSQSDPGNYRCANTPGAGPQSMVLSAR